MILVISNISCANKVIIFGTPLSDTGTLKDDLDMHLEHRFKNCIKFFNFICSNRRAPISNTKFLLHASLVLYYTVRLLEVSYQKDWTRFT